MTMTTTRRGFLTNPLGTLASTTQLATQRDVLICIFQRGGADGLSMVVPHGDRHYYAARPTVAIPKPGGAAGTSTIDLNGYFGLHPALAGLKSIWNAQQLAIVNACGSPDPTHSHFDAMDSMERGTPGIKSGGTGWLGRHLACTHTTTDTPLRAVGFGALLQTALRGGAAISLSDVADYKLHAWDDELPLIRRAHGQLYRGTNMLAGAGQQTLASLDLMERVVRTTGNPYRPSGGAVYPDTDYGRALKQVAQIVKGDAGLQVACVDIGDWDTHSEQGGVQGQLADNLRQFGNGIRALYTDLSAYLGKVTIITMSEFGRRVDENGDGTDHGHGNVMFVMGGNVRGGKIYGRWPGLAPEQRYGPGDLQVTTDFRDVISEIITKRLKNPALDKVFPNYTPKPALGIVNA